MKKEYSLLSWLIANLVLLSVGILMAWFISGSEPSPAPTLISGWEIVFRRIVTSIELLLEYGFAWLWIVSFLQGVGGIFVMSYVVFKIISITRSKSHTGSKALPVALVMVVAVFLFHDLLYELNLPLPGYWLFLLGLFSSAIFELRNSMINE